ncbi:MAG: extracellular solute-binding protein [Firmicutes bacterium]|nr:extracellular solute-binding protein [Bacillota bacterium]MCL5040625.1 extracellular solute-binding protein [Bacillota bacterium]
MFRHKKWFLAVLAMVVVLTLLVGCGSQGTSPAPQPPAEKKSVHLVMYSWRTEDAEAWNKILKAFESANPGITVEFKPFKNTEYNTILATALQGGSTAPDLAQLRPYGGMKSFASGGLLMPLDDKVAALKSFSKATLDAVTGTDGKLYGVPLSINTTQIFYNKAIFEKYGLTPPKTWAELLKTAETLKKNNVIPFAQGSKDGWTLSLMHSILGPNVYGGNAFRSKILKGETNFLDKDFIASLDRLNQLTPYFPKDFTGVAYTDTQALFFSEKAAMFLGGGWEEGYFLKMNPKLQLGVFACPPDTSDKPGTVSSWVDGGYGIYAKTAHPQEALKLASFLASKEFAQMFADALLRVPAVPGVTPKDPLTKAMSTLAEKSSTPYLMLVDFNEGQPTGKATLENSLQGMFLKKLTAAQVAQEVQKVVATWFKPFQK